MPWFRETQHVTTKHAATYGNTFRTCIYVSQRRVAFRPHHNTSLRRQLKTSCLPYLRASSCRNELGWISQHIRTCRNMSWHTSTPCSYATMYLIVYCAIMLCYCCKVCVLCWLWRKQRSLCYYNDLQWCNSDLGLLDATIFEAEFNTRLYNQRETVQYRNLTYYL